MVQVCLGCCGHPRRTRSERHPRARRLVELWIESPLIRPGCWWDDQGGRRLDRSGCLATRMRAGHPSGHWTTKGQAWAQRERPGRRIKREKYRITNAQSEMHIIYICYCLYKYLKCNIRQVKIGRISVHQRMCIYVLMIQVQDIIHPDLPIHFFTLKDYKFMDLYRNTTLIL